MYTWGEKKYKPNQANTERHKICTCPEGQRMSCSLQMARLENRLLSRHCSWPRGPLCRQQTPHRGFTLSDLFSSLYLGLKFQEPLCCFVLTEFPGSANLQYLSFLTFDLLTVHSSCLPGKLIPWEFWCRYTDFFFHSPRVLIWLYWFFFSFLTVETSKVPEVSENQKKCTKVFSYLMTVWECAYTIPLIKAPGNHMDQNTTTYFICTSKSTNPGFLQVGLYDIESHGGDYNFMHLRLSNKIALLVIDV